MRYSGQKNYQRVDDSEGREPEHQAVRTRTTVSVREDSAGRIVDHVMRHVRPVQRTRRTVCPPVQPVSHQVNKRGGREKKHDRGPHDENSSARLQSAVL